ncbi:MAG: sigma-54 dependent transcriptional regulator [Longimicrobiales bacterium]|nr:sigma-54 dependent transcriptional regulator [Longimicrobiales bacterium]
MDKTALVIEDDADVRDVVVRILESAGWTVRRAHDGVEGSRVQGETPSDVVILDLNLPDADGLEILPGLLSLEGEASVVVLTGDDRIPTAVKAMRSGAENFLTKPVDPEHLRIAAEHALEKSRLRRRARIARQERLRHPELDDPEEALLMGGVGEELARYAESESTILLTGETGVGKGWGAAAVHRMSPRRDEPLLDVNCATLSANLLESELFGHEAGAFTGALERKRGLFELADGGTLFLDEVDALAPDLQPKLLKVLETMRFRRVGGTEEIRVDVRVVAASNRDLETAMEAGDFRRDLYYRLAVAPVHVPPLRERDPDEVRALARRVLSWVCREMGKEMPELAPGSEELILRYPWPGNIRELKNVLERTLLLHPQTKEIRPDHLPPEIGRTTLPRGVEGDEGIATLDEVEREQIRKALRHHGGNRTKAAESLGISRAGLYKKLERHGLTDEP